MVTATGSRTLVLGIGAASLAGRIPDGVASALLRLGAGHPSSHGALRLTLELDADDVVLEARPEVGFMHRGAEKLFEARDYRQILMLANRHDWMSSVGNEIGVCLAVERMMGLEVPERATWLRTLLVELTRAVHHLTFLGQHPLPGLPPRGVDLREALLALLEEATGGRMHVMVNRLGGLHQDVPAGWTGRVAATVAEVAARLPEVIDPLLGDDDLRARASGAGIVTADLVDAYGLSGPVARAAGVPMDLRVDEPYLAYGELGVTPTVRTAGDALARLEVMADETAGALDLVRACLDALPAGPIDVKLPKNVKAPEGSTYAWTENPMGVSGYYLVSRGERTPWRLKIRTPSFATVAALPALLPGTRLDQVGDALASLAPITGDVDR